MDKDQLTARGRKFLQNIEFDDNEKLVCEIRKHPFGLFLIYLTGGFISLILFFALVLIPYGVNATNADTGINVGQFLPILILAGLVLLSLALVATVITAYLYVNNVVLVTSEKIAQQLYKTIFNKKISQLSIGDVQDVTVTQTGIFAKIFGYGTLVIETAGEQNNYIFNYSILPFECAKAIVSAHEADVALHGN